MAPIHHQVITKRHQHTLMCFNTTPWPLLIIKPLFKVSSLRTSQHWCSCISCPSLSRCISHSGQLPKAKRRLYLSSACKRLNVDSWICILWGLLIQKSMISTVCSSYTVWLVNIPDLGCVSMCVTENVMLPSEHVWLEWTECTRMWTDQKTIRAHSTCAFTTVQLHINYTIAM